VTLVDEQAQLGKPFFSVVVAVYNGAETLQRCLDSIQAQGYPLKELIIMDGGSSDGTVDILKRNSEKIEYWESSPDKGIYDAWNKALPHIKGEWICFLGADDYFWSKDVLQEAATRLADVPADYRVAYGQVALVNSSDEVLAYAGEPWQKIRKAFFQLMALPHQGVLHHRSLFERHGDFDTQFRIAGDYELLLRELKSNEALFLPDLVIAGMQQGGISSDPSQSLRLLREIRMAHRKLLGGRSGWLWWAAYFRVMFRQILWRIMGENITRHVLDGLRMCVGKPRHWTRNQ